MKDFEFVQIISLSHDWDQYHRREFTRWLAQSTSEWSILLCFEPPVSLLFHTLLKYPQKFKEWLLGRRGVREVEPGIYVCTPFMLTHYLFAPKNKLLAAVERFILRFQFNRILKKINAAHRRRILWLARPEHVALIGCSDEDYLIYDCYDEYRFDNRNRPIKNNVDYEKQLSQQADMIITTSRPLYERHLTYNEKTFFIPNAANTAIFEKALLPDAEIADDLKSIRRPIIGYVGSLMRCLDFELLEYLIKNHPEWSFVFIGGCDRDCVPILENYKTYPHFHHLGYRPHHELYRYLKAFDVALIPFLINDFTKAVFPNKFFEYLAAGCQIVSTGLPDLYAYQNVARIVENKIDFERAIQEIVSTPDKNLAERVEIARQNSWQSRTDDVNHKLLSLIKANHDDAT